MAAALVKKAATALCVAKVPHLTSDLGRQPAMILHWVRPRAAGLIPPLAGELSVYFPKTG
jgi:hypothetical protein